MGIRVPDHPVVRLLLAEYGEPLMSTTLLLPGDELPLTDARDIEERIGYAVDLILDGGNCGLRTQHDRGPVGRGASGPAGRKGRSAAISNDRQSQHSPRIIAANPGDSLGAPPGNFMDLASFLTALSIAAIPVVFAITLHEVAHGWVARSFRRPHGGGAGQVEPQSDPPHRPDRHGPGAGSCCCGLADSCSAGRSPVPVNPRFMRDPRRNMVLGRPPQARRRTLAMAVVWAFLMYLCSQHVDLGIVGPVARS